MADAKSQEKQENKFAGQLTEQFKLPTYAQDMLYLGIDGHSIQTQGKYGQFSFPTTSEKTALDENATPNNTLLNKEPDTVRLSWGAPDGPLLTVWSRPDLFNLKWDGRVVVGGFIERLHAREIGGLEVVIVEVVGGPFSRDHVGLPSLEDMRQGIFARPSDTEPLAESQSYPFVILAESNLAGLAHDALISGIAVDAYGTLASEAGRWHEVVGLPLLMDSLTLLAP